MQFHWDENPDLNITPLVDIMLVLMAILMVTAPVMEYEENINLPQGSAQKATHKIADLSIRIDAKKISTSKARSSASRLLQTIFFCRVKSIPKIRLSISRRIKI